MKNIFFLSLILILSSCSSPYDLKADYGKASYSKVIEKFGPADTCEKTNTGKSCVWTTSVGRNWIDKVVMNFDKQDLLIRSEEIRY